MNKTKNMEQIAKIVKAMFFEEDGSVNLGFATKMRYVVYGIVIGAALTIAGACYMGDEEPGEEATEQVE